MWNCCHCTLRMKGVTLLSLQIQSFYFCIWAGKRAPGNISSYRSFFLYLTNLGMRSRQKFVCKYSNLNFYECFCVELELHLKGNYFPLQKLLKYYLIGNLLVDWTLLVDERQTHILNFKPWTESWLLKLKHLVFFRIQFSRKSMFYLKWRTQFYGHMLPYSWMHLV